MASATLQFSRFWASSVLVLTVAGACSGCGDSQGPNLAPATFAGMHLSPSAAALEPGQSQTFVASCFGSRGAPFPCPALTWTTTGGTRQSSSTPDTSGSYTAGATPGNYAVTVSAQGTSKAATVTVVPAGSGAVVTVVPSVALQTMRGWEATAQAGQQECDPVAFANYRDPLYDRVVTELGINRLRLPLKSGAENPTDHFADLLAGRITQSEWRSVRYAAVNDNNDPNTTNAAGFHFTELDHFIDNVVTPIRDRLNARGEALYVNLNYTDFSSQGAGTFFHKNAPAEYAEFLLVAFRHIQNRYGWTPDAVELVLEPDNAAWSGTQMGRALVAAGGRLAAAGYRPDFIAPSNANMARAIEWFDQLMAVSGVTQYLTDLAYHRYGGVSTGNLQTLSSRAQAHGLRTSMLEHIGSGYQDLHQDLTLGRNSSWQQFILGWCGTNDNGGQYYPIDVSTPTAPRILLGSRTRYLQQYFRDVRLGAVRHEATTTSASFQPLAFRNPGGRWTVVVKANGGGSFVVAGLPAGTYGLTYTTPSAFRTALPDATIGSGGLITATIPAAGVLTIAQ